MEKSETVSSDHFKKFLQILAPFAPHMTEELWHELGENESIHRSLWPSYDELKLTSDTIQIVVQVNSKNKAEITVSNQMNGDEVKALALSQEKVKTALSGALPKKVIYVSGRLVNIVI
jgi:leucyl-tRNA synthetase